MKEYCFLLPSLPYTNRSPTQTPHSHIHNQTFHPKNLFSHYSHYISVRPKVPPSHFENLSTTNSYHIPMVTVALSRDKHSANLPALVCERSGMIRRPTSQTACENTPLRFPRSILIKTLCPSSPYSQKLCGKNPLTPQYSRIRIIRKDPWQRREEPS